MNIIKLTPIVILIIICKVEADAESDFNVINNDGSFSFSHSNDDSGRFYHNAAGATNKVIRGRYGSRNAASGRVEETIYTAGPKGFRARGPSIHRKMDLSQVQRGPIGNRDDPLADPFDDPSYSFSYKATDQQRREDADSTGRVRGLYSYLDDIGERHTVRYAAGQGTGYEVENSIPDTASIVRYSAPLYKSLNRRTRGRIAVQRGPGREYKFISSGPDQRRSETSDPDGTVRGSYSYLDDKGVQRTVEYIAGAGIGYRVLKMTTGPGSHLVPRPALHEFGIKSSQSNDLDDDGVFKKSASGGIRPTLPTRNQVEFNLKDDNDKFVKDGISPPLSKGFDVTDDELINYDKINQKDANNNAQSNNGRSNRPNSNKPNDNRRRIPLKERTGRYPSSNRREEVNRSDDNWYVSNENSSSSKPDTDYNQNSENDFLTPPKISFTSQDLEKDRNNDWSQKSRDSTLLKNVGDWYVGLPPGGIVRAHVQSIDLLPLGNRAPAPGDALKRDTYEKN